VSRPVPTVVLLGGASGAGKTRLSYRLARHLDAALVEVDDLVVAVQALTGARTHPDLHHWRQHDGNAMPVEQVVDGQIRVARALAPAVAAVIENHLETATPVVIEGDYLLPGTATDPRVRTVIVHEDDEDQLVANYAAREPQPGQQRDRARASLAYGRWLVREAAAAGDAVVPARPWDTAFERLLAALGR
jgi:2-phosphoglycerate kinase